MVEISSTPGNELVALGAVVPDPAGVTEERRGPKKMSGVSGTGSGPQRSSIRSMRNLQVAFLSRQEKRREKVARDGMPRYQAARYRLQIARAGLPVTLIR
jgi:hypothetical protein